MANNDANTRLNATEAQKDIVVGRQLLGRIRHWEQAAGRMKAAGRVMLHESVYDDICTEGLSPLTARTVHCSIVDCAEGYTTPSEFDIVHFTLIHDRRGYRAIDVEPAPPNLRQQKVGQVVRLYKGGNGIIIDSCGERFKFHDANVSQRSHVSFDAVQDVWSSYWHVSNIVLRPALRQVCCNAACRGLERHFQDTCRRSKVEPESGKVESESKDESESKVESKRPKAPTYRPNRPPVPARPAFLPPTKETLSLGKRQSQPEDTSTVASVGDLANDVNSKQVSVSTLPPPVAVQTIQTSKIESKDEPPCPADGANSTVKDCDHMDDLSTVASNDDLENGDGLDMPKVHAPAEIRRLLQVRVSMLSNGLNVDELDIKLKAFDARCHLLKLRQVMLRSGLNVDELDQKLRDD